jgi:type VI secretion system Hcp family effector
VPHAIAGTREQRPAGRTGRAPTAARAGVLGLHRLIGNRAVAQLMRAPARRNLVFVKITGAKTGDIEGDVQVKGREGQIQAEKFSMGAKAPTRVDTNEPTGSRQYRELEFHKAWDGASPLLMQALTSNEQLDEVRFEFVHPVAGGGDRVFQVIKLSGARLTAVEQVIDEDGNDVEIVRIRFASIVVENTERKTVTEDQTVATQ